jgi:E3 ubiquitin-protein ligase TRIP12
MSIDSAAQDVLAVCGADLPAWCAQLVFAAPFLFPFALRLRYFHCTAFGLARALQHLQQLQAAEGAAASPLERDSRELRVGRIQRQKARRAPLHAWRGLDGCYQLCRFC